MVVPTDRNGCRDSPHDPPVGRCRTSRRQEHRVADVRARNRLAIFLGETGALVGGELEAGQEGFLDPLEAAESEGVGDAQAQEAAMVGIR